MSLFQKKSFSDDLASDMEKGLIESAEREESEHERSQYESAVLQSLDAIAALAEKCEAEGLIREAELLIGVLEAYAEGDSEKLKNNLLQTGTLFSKQDFGAAKDGEAPGDLHINEEDEKSVEGLLSSFDDEE